MIRRFGPRISQIKTRLQQAPVVAWPRVSFPEVITETADLRSVHSLQGCESFDSIVFYLKQIVDRTCARLRGRGERLQGFSLCLETEMGTSREELFSLPLPLGGARDILDIISERMRFELAKTPLHSAVVEIQLLVTATSPGLPSQKSLFSRRSETIEVWNNLVTRLIQKLGDESVFSITLEDTYKPESSWKKELHAPDHGTTPAPLHPVITNRPTRILSNPLRLHFRNRCLIDKGKTVFRLQTISSPQRITGNWWAEEESYTRDYYIAKTACGSKIWLYQDKTELNPKVFYLQGYFD
jgi:hypothetical protein